MRAHAKQKTMLTLTRDGRSVNYYEQGYPLWLRAISEVRKAINNLLTKRGAKWLL